MEELIKIKEQKGKLFAQEKEEKFELSLKTYRTYFKFVNSYFKIFLTLTLYILSEVFYSCFYYVFGLFDNWEDKDQLFYISGIMMICFIITCISKYLLTILITNKASSNLHHHMFTSITRTNILYFD